MDSLKGTDSRSAQDIEALRRAREKRRVATREATRDPIARKSQFRGSCFLPILAWFTAAASYFTALYLALSCLGSCSERR